MARPVSPDDSICRIAITTGDPNGIGPEVALKAINQLWKYGVAFKPILVGHPSIWTAAAHLLDINLTVAATALESSEAALLVIDGSKEPPRVNSGTITRDGGKASMESVASAIDLCMEGRVDAMVTAPISKEAIQLAGYDVPGHTEFIRDRVGADRVLMLMVSDSLRVAVATGHQPLKTVSESLTTEVLVKKLDILFHSLSHDFGIAHPTVAMLGVNPHAGDGGVLGIEEKDLLEPLINKYQNAGLQLYGPFPADGFFGNRTYENYDALLAMYHDQGLIPFKTLTFNSGVNFTAGLPIVRTSPDHGTAFDIVGQGIASASSMVRAIEQAIEIVSVRRGDRVS